MSWVSILGPSAWTGLLTSAVALGMPTGLAAVGEVFGERAGVLNLGLEGVMLAGALGGFLGAYYTGNPWVGVAVGMMAGISLTAVNALLAITLKTSQVISGIAIVLFSQGATGYIYDRLFGAASSEPVISGLPRVAIPGLRSIPVLGPALFDQSALFYVSLILVFALWWLLFRTGFGLSVRAVGETPEAADAAGIPVNRVRWLASVGCGALAGLGGALLIIDDVRLFSHNVTEGRGWVAIALVIFGRWNPMWVLGGALLFGFTDALQLRIQTVTGGIGSTAPYEVFQALPYLVAVFVVVIQLVAMRGGVQPSALGVPYEKEAGD